LKEQVRLLIEQQEKQNKGASLLRGFSDYLKEQVRLLIEQQEKQNKRTLLTNSQRMRVALACPAAWSCNLWPGQQVLER